jgi:quercetin dioxygenase-like cupin family protein
VGRLRSGLRAIVQFRAVRTIAFKFWPLCRCATAMATFAVATIDEESAVDATGKVPGVAFSIVLPDQLHWTTRPHEHHEPARHVAELQGLVGFEHTRANVWRYEPGARGRRHVHPEQEETFVVLAGRLTMHLGEPPQRHAVSVGGIVHVQAGTPLQTVNEGDEDLVVYAYGSPPDEGAEILRPAV